MNKIMELALSLGNKMQAWQDRVSTLGEVEDARQALQAEVTRVEAEIAQRNDMLKMLAQRARSFPHYPIGFHIPEVFAAVGETPPTPGAKP